jgi:hypothetical protein
MIVVSVVVMDRLVLNATKACVDLHALTPSTRAVSVVVMVQAVATTMV